MSATPCRRCHRLREVNYGGYCTGCEAGLRAEERRRPASAAAAPPPATLQAAAAPSINFPPTATPVQSTGQPPPAIQLSRDVVPMFVLPTLEDEETTQP